MPIRCLAGVRFTDAGEIYRPKNSLQSFFINGHIQSWYATEDMGVM